MTAKQLTGVATDGELIIVPMSMMTDKASIPEEGRVQFHDTITIDAKDPEFRVLPDSGYLVARPRVARTGVQLYRGSEVGKPQMDVVRVYRPESEVFDKASLQSFAFKPLTNDHPSEPVNSKNFRKLAVGMASNDISRDGNYVRLGTAWQDAETIKGILDGKVEISVGYSTDLLWEAGTTPDGEKYDAIQTKIRVNHIANVKTARGGDKLRVGDNADASLLSSDSATKETTMNDVTKTPAVALVQMDVDSIPCQMTDVSAAAVKRKIKALETEAEDLKQQLKASKEEADKKAAKDAETIAQLTKDAGTKDAEIATLKKQVADAAVSPAALDQMVKDRALVVERARALLGDAVKADGQSIEDIRKQVVLAKMGDTAKDWTVDAIKASFDTLTANVSTGGVRQVADAFSGNSHQPHTAAGAYDAYNKRMTDAWKGTPQGNAKN